MTYRYIPELVVVCLMVVATQIAVTNARAEERAAALASARAAVSIDVSRLRQAVVSQTHSIDTLATGAATVTVAGRTTAVVVSRRRTLQINGWAVDLSAQEPSLAVYTTISGKAFIGRTGIQRSDVAAALGNVMYETAGFSLVIPAQTLPLGRTELNLLGVNARNTDSYPLEPAVELVVVP